MKYQFTDRIIALAGVFQAAQLVHEIAKHAQADSNDIQTCLNSIINDTPDSTIGVYGDLEKIRTGLICLNEQLGLQNGKREVEITRYVMGMLFLERKLAKTPALMTAVGEGIEGVRRQLQHYPIEHENVIANLAGVYGDTLSTLSFRIMVSGEPANLANPLLANKIRALLLAGIRSAVLWRQTGGRRWQLLFQRSKIVDQCLKLLQHPQN